MQDAVVVHHVRDAVGDQHDLAQALELDLKHRGVRLDHILEPGVAKGARNGQVPAHLVELHHLLRGGARLPGQGLQALVLPRHPGALVLCQVGDAQLAAPPLPADHHRPTVPHIGHHQLPGQEEGQHRRGPEDILPQGGGDALVLPRKDALDHLLGARVQVPLGKDGHGEGLGQVLRHLVPPVAVKNHERDGLPVLAHVRAPAVLHLGTWALRGPHIEPHGVLEEPEGHLGQHVVRDPVVCAPIAHHGSRSGLFPEIPGFQQGGGPAAAQQRLLAKCGERRVQQPALRRSLAAEMIRMHCSTLQHRPPARVGRS
mmetsp:Transcript_68369/g.216356  ORF Transcript_68369/g.216356 Transcript_68369/m.216356 type:complete len:314 (-) Transcript_68369:124-1065(-)